MRLIVFSGLLWLLFVLPSTAGCPIGRTIVIARLDYDSARFSSEVVSLILNRGFACPARISNKPEDQIDDLRKGKADVIMEIWAEEPDPAWVDGENEGSVIKLGINFGATDEGWFVPTYLVEGPKAEARNLRSVGDLRSKAMAALFKGDLVNCPDTWVCSKTNTKKLAAYGLSDLYKPVTANDDKDLRRIVEQAYRGRSAVLFYGWRPDILLAKYQYVKLMEPKFDRTVWEASRACEYPKSVVYVGANKAFADQNPEIGNFLRAWRMSNDDISSALDDASSRHIPMQQEAKKFLISRPDVWMPWVSGAVAANLRANLSRENPAE
jgi:glycine betaine/proline transport system substrate-binding protein